jgi:pyruvate formate lyase activating enzyme
MKAGIKYEFRTTLVKQLLNEDDILEIGKLIKNARIYILQQFMPVKTLDKEFQDCAKYSLEEMESLRGKLINDIPVVQVR